MAALTTLLDEHETLRPFLGRLRTAAETGTDDEIGQAVAAAERALCQDLDRHIDLEDHEFFPEIADLLHASIVEPFVEDHRAIEQARDALYLQTAQGDDLRRKCLTLCSLLESHLLREEEMLFPMYRSAQA